MKKKIKVLHVGFGGRGGAARVLVDIAKNHSSDFEPSAILLGYEVDGGYIAELKEKGIPCFTILKRSRFDYRFLLGLRKTISNINPNIVLFHTPVAYLWGRLPFVTGKKTSKIVSVEHSASTGYGFFSSIWNLLLSLRTDKIICVSQAVRDYLEKKGFPSKKLVVIENGISMEPLNKWNLMEKNPINISKVARLAFPKDHITLLKAFRIIIDKGYSAVLNIVGDGPLRDDLIQLSNELGISNKVNFMGERKDIRNILLYTDLFVLSTHNEGLSISILEAMEACCPVIATDIPTISQVVQNGVNGLLVYETDELSLANAMMYLIDRPEKARGMAKKGREQINLKFNILNTVKQYEDLFIELIKTGS